MADPEIGTVFYNAELDEDDRDKFVVDRHVALGDGIVARVPGGDVRSVHGVTMNEPCLSRTRLEALRRLVEERNVVVGRHQKRVDMVKAAIRKQEE